MRKTTITIAVVMSLAIGFVAGWSSTGGKGPAQPVGNKGDAVRKTSVPFEYEAPPSKISAKEAIDHRETHYEKLLTVDDVLNLPTNFSRGEALYALAGRADETELQALISQATQIIDRHDRSAALDVLFGRYTESDPHAALSHLLSMNLDTDDLALSTIFSNWARNDLASAIAAANLIENVSLRKNAGRSILTEVSRHNFGEMEAVVAQLNDYHDTTWMEARSIGLRANYDPQAAMFEALSMKSRNGRWSAIQRVGTVWARNDPDGALAALANIPNARMREQYLSAVYGQWLTDDPDGALQNVLALSDPASRTKHLTSLLQTYAEHSPQEAVALAGQLTGHRRDQGYLQVFSSWIRQDVDAALAGLSELPPGTLSKNNMIYQLAHDLGAIDAEKGLAWAATLDPKLREQTENMLLSQLVESDPQRAINVALSNSSAARRQTQLTAVIQGLSRSDPQTALMYVHELPAGTSREHLYRSIASQWAATDPASAMAWAATLSGAEYAAASSGMVSQIALNHPDQAAAMVRAQPAESRSNMLRSIASSIGARGPREAIAWLRQFSNDPAYEGAVAGVLPQIVRSDPDYALGIAAGLSGDNKRTAVQMTMQTWAQMDPLSAARWAANSDNDIQQLALNSVVSSWTQRDADGALAWVQTLRSGETKDNVLATLANNVAGVDVARSATIVNAISNDSQRDQSIIAAYMNLLRTTGNRAVADDFLNRVNASNEVRNHVDTNAGGG